MGTDLFININNIKNFGQIKNSDYGSNNSGISVQCKLQNGKTIFLTSKPLKIKGYPIFRYMNPSKVPLIFFPREYVVGKAPLWFYMWALYDKYTNLTGIFHPSFNTSLGRQFTYRGNGYNVSSNSILYGIANFDNNTDFFKPNLTIYSPSADYETLTPSTGIHCFSSVIVHESEHVNIKQKMWPNGYDPILDTDQDYYLDSWERTDPVAVKYGFLVRTNPVPDVFDKYSGGINSKGFKYEEDLCHNKQILESKNFTNNNKNDWGYYWDNKYPQYQSKQWK